MVNDIVEKVPFDWKIMLWKGLKSLIIVIIAGIGVVYGNNPLYLVLVPLIEMFLNWIKHR